MNNAKRHSDIADFFIEDASEHLHNINADLLTLENNQQELDLVDKIFRSVHAIKGSAGMAGFHITSQLAHSIEDLLGQMRSRELPVSSEIIDLLFQGIDGLTHEVENLSNDEEEDQSLLSIFTDLRDDFLKHASPVSVSQTSLRSPEAQPKPSRLSRPHPPPTSSKPVQGKKKSGVPPLELADRLIRQEHLDKALAVYQKLLREDPSNTMIRQRLAETRALRAYLQHLAS